MKADARIYRNRWLAIIGMAIGVMFCGCTDDLGIEGNRPSDVVCFTASLGADTLRTSSRSTSGHLGIEEEEWRLEGMPEAGGSRASLTTSLTGKAGVIAYSSGNVLSSLKNVEFTFDGDELSSASPVYWKSIEEGLAQMEVYAYAPYDELKNTITGKTFTYTIPTKADEQLDVIVAKSTVASDAFRKTIPLTFTHALTAVRFALGEDIAANDVQSITISGVHNQGSYTIGEGWSEQTHSGEVSYTVTPNELLMLMPQTLPEDATVTLTDNNNQTIKTELKGKWEAGKLITYTLHQGTPPSYIYFDLAAGNVEINATSYSGYVFQGGQAKHITDSHNPNNHYYVYQSTSINQGTTGLQGDGSYILPEYKRVMLPDGRTWADFITNNPNVEEVIETWDDAKNVIGKDATGEGHIGVAVVREVERSHTENRITVMGQLICRMTLDNVYSTYQDLPYDPNGIKRNSGSITFNTKGKDNSKLYLNLKGDNRLGSIHYDNDQHESEIVFEGEGSLTVADADFNTDTSVNPSYAGGEGYFSNHWFAAIGGNNNTHESVGITINSGVIFAGTTKAENCSAIGGGGNRKGDVTINGGVVTAVATTTGTAIGGGIGFVAQGGEGTVRITGGNVYAYNHANRWNIPSSAIGGGGSSKSTGASGSVTITGGNVYAESALGTAIGGGSSSTNYGGDAEVTITGGYVVAKNKSFGAGIGGGSAYTGGGDGNPGNPYNGGTAKIEISGNPIIRTGSIGGGSTLDPNGKIGSADILVEGGDIQAQFVMAAGAKATPQFKMSGELIRNSDIKDAEYCHIEDYGGAVYLEDGTFTMENGVIENCTAIEGGAVYIKGTNQPTFTMSGGEIRNCTSQGNGGAVYLEGGTVTLKGGTISDNLAQGGNGGGIYIKEGSFEMDGTDAVITENSAILRSGKGGNGGGLYVTSEKSAVTVNILSGNITSNTSDRWGGGVCVDMSGTSQAAHVKVGTSGMTNPDISKNHTLLSGGGLYVSGTNANITINGGKIMDNTTSAYVANVNVANEGGMVTLNDGNVTHNVVTFYANGGMDNPHKQNIVTATNSLLVAPTFTRVGYRLVGWNTRADGRGGNYTDGQVMNISEDMELYAQWELD